MFSKQRANRAGRQPRPRAEQGFTLVELIVAIAILAILTSMAIPSYRTSVLNNRQRSAASDLVTIMHAARSEAAKQGDYDVVVCSSTGAASGCSGNSGNAWRAGVLVFVDKITAGASKHALDADETVLTYVDGLPQQLNFVTSKDKFVFSPFITPPNPSTNGTITLCDDRGNGHARAVVVNTSGRARVEKAGESGVSLTCS